MKKQKLKELVEEFGQKYSDILGIDLSGREDHEIFKWFLASVLFGAPITESSVIKTYRCFEKHDVLTPKQILETGWDGLVRILDEGSYTRYDFKTANKLLAVMQSLLKKYDGRISLIHAEASDKFDLENRLKALAKGIGDVTVSIFLRELRDIWEKADPNPTDLEILAAKELGIVKRGVTTEDSLKLLKIFWTKNAVAKASFVNFETALVRMGRVFRRKSKKHEAVG